MRTTTPSSCVISHHTYFCYSSLSLRFSHSVLSNSLQPRGLQHSRLPCPSPSPWVCSNSCPLDRWCHPALLSSVVPFSSCLQSFPTSGSFLMSQLLASGGQSIGASASVLPVNIQDWFPLELTAQNWLPKNWCFWTMVEKTVESPLDCEDISQFLTSCNCFCCCF